MVDWSFFKVSPNQFPKIKGSGPLLIVGGGRCVWDDFDKLGRRWDGDILTINDITQHFPLKVKHCYSNDSKMVPRWISARRPRYRILFEETIIPHSCNEGDVNKWPFRGGGSSAFIACLVGLGMGYDQITLIGCPLDNSGHYFDPPWVETKLLREVPEGNEWQASKHIFRGKVKSLSGRTKQILGD